MQITLRGKATAAHSVHTEPTSATPPTTASYTGAEASPSSMRLNSSIVMLQSPLLVVGPGGRAPAAMS
jgi:hypothetical protein